MNATEKQITRELIDTMDRAGFKPRCVHDGEEYVPATTTEAVIKVVESVGVATVHFERDGKWGKFGVLLVEGNGRDLISDWHCGSPLFDNLVQDVCEMPAC